MNRLFTIALAVALLALGLASVQAQDFDLPPDDPVLTSSSGDSGGRSGLRGWKAGKFFGKAAAIGIGTGATAVIVRTAYEGRALNYGEGFCTIENFGVPGLKLLRLVGSVKHNWGFGLEDLFWCSEQKVQDQYEQVTQLPRVPRAKQKKLRR